MQLHSHAEVKKIIEHSEHSEKKRQDIIQNHLQTQ